ncbi:MAG: cytochrome c [Gemmatimonadetes bacterium]|nr:cytochrome c [Gemmatimonadota bacterium]
MTATFWKGRAATARLFAFVAAASLSACATASPEAPASTPTPPATSTTASEPLTPVYTAGQATRGQGTFAGVCSTCHSRNEFAGPIFAITWRAEPLSGLYQQISTNMPQDRPGSLTPQQYVDVLAYILQLNGIQPGNQELVADPTTLARMDW